MPPSRQKSVEAVQPSATAETAKSRGSSGLAVKTSVRVGGKDGKDYFVLK